MATTTNSSANYQEDLFQAIDTIVQARIADLPYDKTIECKVVDISQSAKNVYKVEYENARFEATSTITGLAINDIVYVQVPQGDFRRDKLIVARKKAADTQNTKTLPFLSFIRGNNLFGNIQYNSKYSIQVNSNKEADMQFIFTQFYGEDLAYGYTRMGVKASISANINTELIAGDYGIKITIYGYDQKQLDIQYSDGLLADARNSNNWTGDNGKKFYKEFTFTKKDMVGTNLYNTHGFQNQEKVFDISGWVIDNIIVTLWQDNKFIDSNGIEIENEYITFSGLSLYLGYDKSEFSNVRYSQSSKYDDYLDQLEKIYEKDLAWMQKEVDPQYQDSYANYIAELQALMIKYTQSLNLSYTEEASILDAITKRYNNNISGIIKTRIKTKDGLLYDKPSLDGTINRTIELYILSVNFDTNTFTDVSSRLKNVFLGIERYVPTNGSASLRSGKYSFLLDTTQLIASTVTDFNSLTVDVHKNNVFLDPDKNGYVFLIFNRQANNTSDAPAMVAEEINQIINDVSTVYYPSNELWFVHKTRASLLDSLFGSDLTETNDNVTIVSGSLIYSGPELLFKSSDGTVLLRLNVNNTQLNGNAESATNYTMNGNIYKNFEKIKTAIEQLGGSYDII